MVYPNYFVKDQNKKQFKIKYSEKLPQGGRTQDLLKVMMLGFYSFSQKRSLKKKIQYKL